MQERHELAPAETGHWGDASKLGSARLLRGRVLVRRDRDRAESATLWTPETKSGWAGTDNGRGGIHYATVVRMGPPMLTRVYPDGSGGNDVPPGFQVGDRVAFVFALATEKARSFKDDLVIIGQEEVVGVVG